MDKTACAGWFRLGVVLVMRVRCGGRLQLSALLVAVKLLQLLLAVAIVAAGGNST